MKLKLLIIGLIFALSVGINAETILNSTLYGGYLYNENDRNGSTEDDSALMAGLYLQVINTDWFQFNDFIYRSNDINDSDITGNHFNFDFYPFSDSFGKFVTGMGIDYIGIETETDIIELDVDVWAVYGRVGQYFNIIPAESLKFSLLPWIGYEYDDVKTTGDFKIFFPGQPDLDDHDKSYFLMTGLNFSADYMHFLQLSLKYYRKYDIKEKDYPNIFTAMANIFFTQHLGISYYFKYMELASGKNIYNLAGVTLLF